MNKAESYLKGATKRVAKAAGTVASVKKGAEAKLQNAGATMRKNATTFAKDVKKSGIHPMNDKGIIGNAPKVMRAAKAKKAADAAQLKAIHKSAAKR